MAPTHSTEEQSPKEPKPKGILLAQSRSNVCNSLVANRKQFDQMWNVAGKAAMLCRRTTPKQVPGQKKKKGVLRTRHLFSKNVSKILVSAAGKAVSDIATSEGRVLRTNAKGETKSPLMPRVTTGFVLFLEQFLSAYVSEGFKNALVISRAVNGSQRVNAKAMQVGMDMANNALFVPASLHPGAVPLLEAPRRKKLKRAHRKQAVEEAAQEAAEVA